MGIFGHGLYRKAADLFQRGAANDGAGAAEKGRVPVVVPLLNRAIKQHPFVRNIAAHGEVALKGVRRIEVVRRLHQRQHRIVEESAHRRLQKDAGCHVIAIKNADKLAVGQRHRVVEVARLGVFVIVTGDIPNPNVGGEYREFIALTVIQQIDF